MADKVSQELIVVTPQMAEGWITNAAYPRQRQVSISMVDFLAEHMIRGTFRQGTQISFCRVSGGSPMLTNGQHTLRAIAKSGKGQIISVMYHDVETEREADWIYVQEDRQRPRGTHDIYIAFGTLGDMGLRTKTQLNSIGTSVKYIMAGFNRHKGRNIFDEDFLIVMREYRDAAILYFSLIDCAYKNTIRGFYRAPTLSVGLTICRYAIKTIGREKISDFFNGAALDDGLKIGDPRKSLLYHLRNDTLGMSISGEKNRVPLKWSMYRVANCWNAWANDNKIDLEPSVSMSRPLHITGTPFVDPDRQ